MSDIDLQQLMSRRRAAMTPAQKTRSMKRHIGTITTRDRWAIVDGDRMRMLTADENLLAMSFPADTLRPANHRLTVHMAGNAVPPVAGMRIIQSLLEAA